MKAEDLTEFEAEMARLRKTWPPGPWMREPDRVQWKTRAGYPGLVERNMMGVWCGYVGLPPGHACYGKDYNDVDVDVHGGLTYANKCGGAICHVPDPGEPDDVWWLGFDLGHGGQDVLPGMIRFEHEADVFLGRSIARWREDDVTYKDLAYAQGEVESLAAQLKDQEAS